MRVMGQKYKSTLSFFLSASAVIGFLKPAFVTPGLSITDRITFLIDFRNLGVDFFGAWLLIIFAVFTLYVGMITIRFRKEPITVLKSNFVLSILDTDGNRARATREQWIRANQPNVNAYYQAHESSEKGGWINKSTITTQAETRRRGYNLAPEVYGPEYGRVDVIQLFEEPLPYKIYMPLIPLWILRHEHDKLPAMLGDYIVRRRSEVIYENEYNVEQPVIYFTSGLYSLHEITITVNFEEGGLPELDDVVARKILINRATTENIIHDTANQCFRVNASCMLGEKLVIWWKNKGTVRKAETGSDADGSGYSRQEA